MNEFSFAQFDNIAILEQQHRLWKENPGALSAQWHSFFKGFELGYQALGQHAAHVPRTTASPEPSQPPESFDYLEALRAAYIREGHKEAAIYPLQLTRERSDPGVRLDYTQFQTQATSVQPNDAPPNAWTRLLDRFPKSLWGHSFLGKQAGKTVQQSLAQWRDFFKAQYQGPVGSEWDHLDSEAEKAWLSEAIEAADWTGARADKAEKERLYTLLMQASDLESFLHQRFLGQKRFGLEGCESLILGLNQLTHIADQEGLEEIMMGMAHRGRLNVLTHFLGQPLTQLFQSFDADQEASGALIDDVRYHLGFHEKSAQGVARSLLPNPSHLESVYPVVLGAARARAWERARHRGSESHLSRRAVLPLVIHGDAALAGQGIVAEALNCHGLKGYRVGGALHVVINNQIGFTTEPYETRSTQYCTDIAKAYQMPVFHVNADAVYAVREAFEIALRYRQQFGKDVFIDLIAYRKHGHNEVDEPRFTQPTLYKEIATHPGTLALFSKQLEAEGTLNASQQSRLRKAYEDELEQAHHAAQSEAKPVRSPLPEPKKALAPVTQDQLYAIFGALSTIPEGFRLNTKIKRQLEQKKERLEADQGIDWALAEAFAFGSLLESGMSVRLSGQDVKRGTFSQRHCVYFDQESGLRYVPLNDLSEHQAPFWVFNSPLSEEAALAFEFGFSTHATRSLCLWEAQFGDFVNGAQVILDQYLSSSAAKWNLHSNMVLLLPHGFEGQGPEHSSARLERFLQSCAQNNLSVCNASTPAQYFHVLRKQWLEDRPLVLMTPKSLLRHPKCVSKKDDFCAPGAEFQPILRDPEATETAQTAVLCSGKVYYDLEARRAELPDAKVHLIRIEQLYPFPEAALKQYIDAHPGIKKWVWCQEEPQNMGAWSYIEPHLRKLLGTEIHYAGRQAAASPATGFPKTHHQEQLTLLDAALC